MFPSPNRCEACVKGWLDQLGPAFPHHKESLARMYVLATKYAHDELPAGEALAGVWRRTYGRWDSIYRKLLLSRRVA